MNDCVFCGEAEATHRLDPFGDDDRAACRPCWKSETNPRVAMQSRGPDWAERNPEAAAHEAGRNRMVVIENRGGGL